MSIVTLILERQFKPSGAGRGGGLEGLCGLTEIETVFLPKAPSSAAGGRSFQDR